MFTGSYSSTSRLHFGPLRAVVNQSHRADQHTVSRQLRSVSAPPSYQGKNNQKKKPKHKKKTEAKRGKKNQQTVHTDFRLWRGWRGGSKVAASNLPKNTTTAWRIVLFTGTDDTVFLPGTLEARVDWGTVCGFVKKFPQKVEVFPHQLFFFSFLLVFPPSGTVAALPELHFLRMRPSDKGSLMCDVTSCNTKPLHLKVFTSKIKCIKHEL